MSTDRRGDHEPNVRDFLPPEALWPVRICRLPELRATAAEAAPPLRRDRLAVSVLPYTSGTTGLPKGTVHVMEETLTVPDGFGRHGGWPGKLLRRVLRERAARG